jgi:dipeptidyl aminopeptidase/acylaminoacyl peptidase
MPTPAPCGSWRSPISARMLAEQSIGIGAIALDGDDLYWLEMRPADGGRYVLVRRDGAGSVDDVTAAPHNVRTRVHEYGGGAYTVDGGVAWYSNVADGRLYRLERGAAARAITREGELRYADMVHDGRRGRLLCVREDHELLAVSTSPGGGGRPPEVVNTIVAVPADGAGEQRVLLQGADFYAAPRLSPDGARMAWLSWNHPDMPWDGCELWLAEVAGDGSLANPRLVAGGREESICQPQWSPDGVLYFVSDRSGWWNVHRLGEGGVEALTAERAEFGQPHWQFDMSQCAFDGASRLVCTSIVEGVSRLGVVDTASRTLTPIALPHTYIAPSLRARDGRAYMVAATPDTPRALVSVALDSAEVTVLRRATSVDLDPAFVSAPQTVEFPTANGRTAWAFHYPPRNPDFSVPAGETPPLLVRTHGGPTSMTPPMLQLDVQYWTTRGFGVLDVNYGGSSGYGREYRRRLDGRWGIVDVEDCENAALHMVRQGAADGRRLAIDGGSAGGYTTLASLTFGETFAAGASHYGVADLELLARHTHKFESRYMDRLVGRYPEQVGIYHQRSPIHHTDRLARPVILFQGLDDRVVPPAQAEAMFAAVKAKGLPCAYLAFEGEDHGFRKAENIIRAEEGELYFYSQVFDFAPADHIDPVPIENLDAH